MLRFVQSLILSVALFSLADAVLASPPEPVTPSSVAPEVTHFRLAVLDFGDNSGGTVKESEILYLLERVRGAARLSLPSRNFVIMTRENIQELLPEGRSLADCLAEECAVETGRKIGADYVVTGEVSSFAGEIRMTVNLHEVAKGNLLKQVNVKGAQLLEVEKELDNKVQELLGLLRSKFPAEVDIEQEEWAMSGAVGTWKAGGQAKVTDDATIVEEKDLTLEVKMPGTAKMPRVFRKVGRTAGFSVLTTYARLVQNDLNNRYPTTEQAWGVRVEKTLIGRTGLGAQIGYNGAYVFTVVHSWNRAEIGSLVGAMFQNDGDNCLYPFGEMRLRLLLGAVVNLDISGGYVRWHNQQGVPLVTVGVGAGF